MRIIDLTLGIHEGMPTCPAHWHPHVETKIMGTHEVEGRATRKLTLGSHTGTHVDAPLHFLPNGHSIDQIPLTTLVGRAHLVDFSHKKKGSSINMEDLEQNLRDIEKGARLVVRTDWSDRWQTKDYYSDFPFLEESACRWLIEKGISLLGVDTPSPDRLNSADKSLVDSPNHKLLFEKGVVLVEYLTNLREIREQSFWLIALPLKLIGFDGSPARVIAVIPALPDAACNNQR